MKEAKVYSLRCLQCDNYLISHDVHDFVACVCSNQAFIDGGRDYLRYGAKDFKLIKVYRLVPFKDKKK